MKRILKYTILSLTLLLTIGFINFNFVKAAEINGSDLVDIPDENLRRYLESYFGIEENGDITVDDMHNIPLEFNLSMLNIKDLTGLEYAVNIEILNLSMNDITDLSPVNLPIWANSSGGASYFRHNLGNAWKVGSKQYLKISLDIMP